MRALALSGGGALGALQVGMLLELTEKCGVFWKRISGVSVGAINGALLAQYPATKEGAREGARHLERLWREEIKDTSSIYTSSAFDLANALSKGALFDTKPLKSLLHRHWSLAKYAANEIRFSVGCVDFYSGEYRTIVPGADDFVPWIMASACFPIAFPPVKIKSNVFLDGGIRHVLPTREVFLDSPGFTVDALLCAEPSGKTLASSVINTSSAFKVAPRVAEILVGSVVRADVEQARVLAKDTGATFNLIAPTTQPAFDSLKFEQGSITAMIAWGRALAATAISSGMYQV